MGWAGAWRCVLFRLTPFAFRARARRARRRATPEKLGTAARPARTSRREGAAAPRKFRGGGKSSDYYSSLAEERTRTCCSFKKKRTKNDAAADERGASDRRGAAARARPGVRRRLYLQRQRISAVHGLRRVPVGHVLDQQLHRDHEHCVFELHRWLVQRGAHRARRELRGLPNDRWLRFAWPARPEHVRM